MNIKSFHLCLFLNVSYSFKNFDKYIYQNLKTVIVAVDESPRQAVTVNNSRGRSTQGRQRIGARSTEEYKKSAGEATA
jgi:hypothetical protein